MDHALVYFGGGEVMYYIAEAMATILGDVGFCRGLFRIIGFLGVAWCTIRFIYTRDSKETIAWFGSFILLTTFAYSAKMNVRIIDKVSGFERRVDNVPWIWGKPAYLLNRMSILLAQKLDQVFTAIPHDDGRGGGAGVGGGAWNRHYIPYYETGTVFASKLISKARHFKIMDPTFNGNLERFVNQCVVYGALIGNKYSMKDLLNSDDIWGLVKANASPVMGFSYRVPDGEVSRGEDGETLSSRSRIVTCREGVQMLEAEWGKQMDEASRRYGKAFFPNIQGDAAGAFLEKLPQSYQLLTGITKNAGQLLQQSMMMNAIATAPNKKLSEMGSAMNYATTKTLLQQRSNFAIAGEVARDTLPIIKVVLEALTYASFIFVFFIALLPRGFRVFKTYFEMLLSLQLWPLLYTILNFVMTIYGRWQTGGVVGTGLNMGNASAIAEINADIAAYAGYWSMLVPIFAYMITKGGVSSMVQAAGQIGNAFMSASASAAQEVTSGNVSLGNMQYGTQSILNTSGFKHDTGLSHKSNQMESFMENGTLQTIHGNGEASYKENLSQLGVKISSSDHISEQASNEARHTESLIKGFNKELFQSQTMTAAKVVDAASTFSAGFSSGTMNDTSQGYTVTKSLQNIESFRSEMMNRYGLTETQASQLSASIGAGGSIKGLFTASMGLNFTNEAQKQAAYEDIKAASEQYNLQDSIEKSAQGMEKIHFGENSAQEQRLAESISASYQKSEGYKTDISEAQQYHDSMSHLAQTMKSVSLNAEWDQTQNFIKWAANQEDNGHRLGEHTVLKMLKEGGSRAHALVAEFNNHLFNDFKSTIQGSNNVLSQEEFESRMKDPNAYEKSFRQNNQIEGSFNQSVSKIKEETQIAKVSDQARNDYERNHIQVEQKMQDRENDLSDKINNTKETNQEQQDRNTTGKMFENLIGGIKKPPS
jgi:conjugal transfer mating pair stabilization protein TraG